MNLYKRIQAILNALDEDDGVVPRKQHHLILMNLSSALQQMAWGKLAEDVNLDRTLYSAQIATEWVILAEKLLQEAGL